MFGRKNKKESKRNSNVEASQDMSSTKSTKTQSSNVKNCSGSSSKR